MSSQQAAGNRGIRVRRDTIVSVEDDPRPVDDRSPLQVTTTIGSGESASRPRGSRRPKTFSATSNSADMINSRCLSDTSKQGRRQTMSNADERETSRDLIDFLRNTPPPPQNFMSTPDPLDDNAEKIRRRHTFWPFGKKAKKENKETRPVSELIKLPDSAVAGRTIDGHRHIAISIPTEHAHLEPLAGEPAPPPATPPRESVSILKQAENTSESPRSKARRKRVSFPAHDDRFSLLWNPNDSMAQLHDAQTQSGGAEPRRSLLADTLVGAPSMNVTPPPELTTLQKGPVSPADLVTNRLSDRADSLHSNSSDMLDAAPLQTMDQILPQERPSAPGSLHTTSSESIPSDAVTFHIPSPPLPAELPESPYPQSADADAETTSFSASELDQSSLTSRNQDTADETELSEDDGELFPFFAFNSQSTPGICETAGEVALLHPTPGSPAVYQSRTLDDIITSLESLLPKQPSSHTLRTSPVMTVIDIQPSPPVEPSPATFADDDSPPPPIRDHADRLLQTLLPSSSPEETTTEPTPPAPPSSATPTPSTTPTANPTPTPANPATPLSLPRTHSHAALIQRYTDLRHMSDAREHELCVLQRRVAQLEDTGSGDHWLMNIHSVFAAIARVLMMGRLSPSSGLQGVIGAGENRDGNGGGGDRGDGGGDTGLKDVDSGLGPGSVPRRRAGCERAGQDRGSGGGERDIRCRRQRRVRWSDEVVVWDEDRGYGSRLRSATEAGDGRSRVGSSAGLLSFREHETLVESHTRRSRRMSGGWRSREEEAIANNLPLAQVDDDFSHDSDGGRGLESVMRELIIGARDEPLGTTTLAEEPGYARWFREPNGFNSG